MDLHFLTLERLIIATREQSTVFLDVNEASAIIRMLGYGRKTMTEIATELDRLDAERRSNLQVDDRVLDPIDGEWRTVRRVEDTTVHMKDGGCMGTQECRDVLLPGETPADHVYRIEFLSFMQHIAASSIPHAWSVFIQRNNLTATYGYAVPENATIHRTQDRETGMKDRYQVDRYEPADDVWNRTKRFTDYNEAVFFQADMRIGHEGPGRLVTRITDRKTGESL